MGPNPKELPKEHSQAHIKAMILRKIRHCKAQIVMPEPKFTRYFSLTALLTSRTFGGDLRKDGCFLSNCLNHSPLRLSFSVGRCLSETHSLIVHGGGSSTHTASLDPIAMCHYVAHDKSSRH